MTSHDGDAWPVASIVIAARNAAGTIEDQFECLVGQRDIEQFEIVVVDNDSTDETAAVAVKWLARMPGLRVIEGKERHGVAYAKNVGIAAAQSDKILLCDADDRAGDDWAGLMLRALETADAVEGKSTYSNMLDGPAAAEAIAARPRLDFLNSFGGGNAAFMRPVWRAVGGFDESVGAAEDLDLGWRMQIAGFRIAYEEHALMWCRPRSKPSRTFRQTVKYGRASVRLYERFREQGMPRSPSTTALKSWARLVLDLPSLLRDVDTRRGWCRRAGIRIGRVLESASRRVLYL